MASAGADLLRIHAQVGRALAEFLDRQRPGLVRIGVELLPWLEAITELLAGGKRLRPAFCYWGWRAFGQPDCPQIMTAAAALELLHASALAHDDVMDGSDTRRGSMSVHRRFAARHGAAGWRGSAEIFGTGAAILIGDLLQSWTDEMFHGSGLPAAALLGGRPVLDMMRTEVVAGQYLDLLSQAAGDGLTDSALRVARYKSAKYTIERPLQLGVALASAAAGSTAAGSTAAGGSTGPDRAAAGGSAGEAAAVMDACTGYGIPLGVAFQLRDDILGMFGDPAATGKPVSDDLREGKRTVLIALTRERASAAQAELLDRRLGDQLLDEDGAAAIRSMIVNTGALAECELMIDANVKAALHALDHASITEAARQALAELAVAATARSD